MTNTCPRLPPGMAGASWQKHFELLWGSDYIIFRINKPSKPTEGGWAGKSPKHLEVESTLERECGVIFNQVLNQLFYWAKTIYMKISIDRQRHTDGIQFEFEDSPLLTSPSVSTIVQSTSESSWCLKSSDSEVSTYVNSSPSSPIW